MFENVLDPSRQPGRRFGAGAVITVLVHVAVVALVAWVSSRPVEAEATPAEVKFFSALPSPPPAAAPPPAASEAPTQPKVEEKKREKRPKKPQEIVAPKEIPVEKPKEAEPEPAPAEPEPEPEPAPAGEPGGLSTGIEGGKPGGTEGGSAVGVVGGTGTGTDVVSFGEGMTRPEHIKHPPEFQCPREAREAQVEGVLLASCTVTLDGWLRDCKIIKPLPHLDKVAMELLQRWRVGPVYFQGRPVLVNYKIPIRMVCK